MKLPMLACRSVCFALLPIFALPLAAAEPPEGFRALFNGESLEGWHGRPHFSPIKLAEMSDEERSAQIEEWTADAKKHWTVEDGELVNDGSGAYLVTDEEFRDYELLIEYKTVPRADSGIYLKGTPQVQIWDYTDPAKFKNDANLGSGGLWNNSPGAPGKNPLVLADRPLGEWNSFRIIQVGARTTVYLNDKLVVDNAIMENYWDRESPLFAEGPIELQTHGGEIRWRNCSSVSFRPRRRTRCWRRMRAKRSRRSSTVTTSAVGRVPSTITKSSTGRSAAARGKGERC